MPIADSYARGRIRLSPPFRERLREHSYVSMLYIGAITGIFAGTHWAELHGLSASKVFLTMLLIFPAALVGARLLFVALHWRVFARDRKRIWSTSEGGAALYGGLVLSFLLSLALNWMTRLPLGRFWDAVAIAMLVGMIFTRTGCALQGCCAGRPSQSWIAFPMPDVHAVWRRRLPFPLFEVGVAALTLAVCTKLFGESPGGCLFLGALAMYAGGRWLFEPTREKVDRFRGWSVHRMISVVLILVGLGGLLLFHDLRSAVATVAH
jgi:phosphatidylglycerol:prolipoprotein diacylglycerol transferase